VLTEALDTNIGGFSFLLILQEKREPTSGLEPLASSLYE
jgi:hypothetical protein